MAPLSTAFSWAEEQLLWRREVSHKCKYQGREGSLGSCLSKDRKWFSEVELGSHQQLPMCWKSVVLNLMARTQRSRFNPASSSAAQTQHQLCWANPIEDPEHGLYMAGQDKDGCARTGAGVWTGTGMP